MSTFTQTNRANAALSTGPVTAEGKAASSRNATVHGLTSKKLVLAHEDQQKFDGLREGFLGSYAPANEFEIACVERLTITYWRLERSNIVETALWNSLIDLVAAASPEEAMATVFTDETYSRKLKLFMRYQSAITRDYNKALVDLRRAQADRKAREAEEADTSAEPVGFVSHKPSEVQPPTPGSPAEARLAAAHARLEELRKGFPINF